MKDRLLFGVLHQPWPSLFTEFRGFSGTFRDWLYYVAFENGRRIRIPKSQKALRADPALPSLQNTLNLWVVSHTTALLWRGSDHMLTDTGHHIQFRALCLSLSPGQHYLCWLFSAALWSTEVWRQSHAPWVIKKFSHSKIPLTFLKSLNIRTGFQKIYILVRAFYQGGGSVSFIIFIYILYCLEIIIPNAQIGSGDTAWCTYVTDTIQNGAGHSVVG